MEEKSSPALAVLAAAAALGLMASPASAGGRHHPPSPPPVPAAGEVTTVAGGLVGPLSFAVGRGGTIDVAQSFAGIISRVTDGGGTELLAAAPQDQPYGTTSVSRTRGTTYFSVSADNCRGYHHHHRGGHHGHHGHADNGDLNDGSED
ncbi:hypothetical protein [Arthrobacter yangruifuii]|uniref:hypothetical protein n=1 Tax=Arthrobacter yangruifuii TaxID=2606616 RepID=UPI0011B5B1E9|nr:hypothetical protein [Arthrobacter yangruifuii]